MSGPQPIRPGELAKVDQHAAQLAEIVELSRRHMRTCPAVPAGVCIGQMTSDAIAALCWADLANLLQEAVAQLAASRRDGG